MCESKRLTSQKPNKTYIQYTGSLYFGGHKGFIVLTAVCLSVSFLQAHPVTFNSTMTYCSTQPAGTPDSVANWTGAAFDAANIGGSGVNADGDDHNGFANDQYTYVANNQPIQGQTFTTGGAEHGYQLSAITVRMAGYTDNIATGSNRPSWNLNQTNGPIILGIRKLEGTTLKIVSKQLFTAGQTGNPGSDVSTNGAGTYITFHLPFTTYLEPNTTYGFEFRIGNGGSNFFEWLGIGQDVYAAGTAYHRDGDADFFARPHFAGGGSKRAAGTLE